MDKAALEKILEAHKKWLNGEADGERADLRDTDLSGADLRDTDLSGADLRDTDLSGADLRCANLSGANLSGAVLSDADLSGAVLSYADLSYADLSRADLRYANLSSAALSSADLSYANLSRAALSSADLSYANLSRAALSGADLSYANLSRADLRDANLSYANLSSAKGLLDAINYMEAHFERTVDGYIAYKTFGAMYAKPEKWNIKPGSVINENVNMCRADECGCGINVAPLDWVRKNYKGEIWKVLIRWEWLVGVCVPYNTDGKIRCERVELVEIVKEEQENGAKTV